MDCEQRDRVLQERGQTRGACPGAFTPMASGDGWLVRIRTGARAVSSRELRALARLAREHGNGIIEVTRRANLQLRGVRLERISELQAELIALGLVDASPVREGRPGLLVDPVAAIEDPSLTEPALLLDEALAESAVVSEQAAKLSVVLDAGSGSVSGVDADIRVVVSDTDATIDVDIDGDGNVDVASRTSTFAQIHLGTHSGSEPLGSCPVAHLPELLRALLRALSDFARTAAGAADSGNASSPKPNGQFDRAVADHTGAPVYEPGKTRATLRMRDLVAARGGEALRAELEAFLTAPAAPLALPAQPRAALGFDAAGSGSWFGIAVPFGSASHTDWVAIAELAERFGSAELRLTPGRELLIVGVRCELADRLAQVASRLGFITEPNDPRRHVIACSGAPACSSAYGETRSLANALQPLLAAGTTLHVSGCEKACASRAAADVSVVLAQDGARLALNADVAAASGAPVETLATISAKLSSREPVRMAR